MRCAIISDIHGNLDALKAVLADAGSIDQLWCLGDIMQPYFAGFQPPELTPKPVFIDEKIEKIQKYLQKGLADKILFQRDKIFKQLCQYTAMALKMRNTIKFKANKNKVEIIYIDFSIIA